MYKELYERRRSRSKRERIKNQNYYRNIADQSGKTSTSSKFFDQEITKRKYVEIDYTLDGSVKQLFLNLTRMQIPFDYEKTLAVYFPDDMQVDGHGNYWKKIGDSKVMFCGHLDTYCREYKRVWHIIEGDKIKTDGTTTLGGDDKAGITIMLKMMEANISGLYYFFRGEEGVTSPTGTWGSKQALKSRGDFFKDYDKCIAFDRKGNTSIISEQMYTECCSDEFVKALEDEFKNNGLEYKGDPTGMWCDSGVFMETIPECTNISVGYKSEHTFNEEQDLGHLEKLVDACIKIDWEKLPVKRDPTKVTRGIGRYKYDWDYDWDYYGNAYSRKKSNYYKPATTSNYSTQTKRDYVTMDEMFEHVVELLEQLDYECLNPDSFKEVEEMYFMNYATNDFFAIRIIDFEIYMSEDDTLKKYTNVGSLEKFKRYVMTGVNPSDIEEIDTLDDAAKRHLDSISREVSSIKKSDNIEKDKINFHYSKLQMDTFRDFAERYPDIVKTILNNYVAAGEPTLSTNMWLDIDKKMIELKYKVDYSSSSNSISPDDFSEWVVDNWKEMKELISKKEKDENQSHIPKVGFLNKISKDIDYSKYHYDQYQIFQRLVDDEKELIKLVLKDFEINNKAEIRDSTVKKIWEEIVKINDNLNIKSPRKDRTLLTAYPDIFIRWAYEYKDDIKKYYNIRGEKLS